MESKFFIDPNAPTDISSYRGKVISFLKMQLAGKGKITSCIINFFNEGDAPDNYAWMKLSRAGFATSPVLVPDNDGCFLVLEYDYCTITQIAGDVFDGDKIQVLLKEIPMA